MKKTIQFLILFFAVFSVFGQKSALHYEIIQAKESNIHFENVVLLETSVNREVLDIFINPEEVFFYDNISIDVINNEVKAMNLEIPLNNKTIVLELVEVPDYFYEYAVNDEEIFPVNRDIKHYRGIVKDNYNSIVAITFLEDEIMGIVGTDEGDFNIAKDSLSGMHIFYNENNLKDKEYPDCYSQYDASSLINNGGLSKERTVFSKDGRIIIDPTLNKIVKIYVETRYNIYTDFGSSIKKVRAYVSAVFNQVAALYLQEDIYVGVSYQCNWKAADIYTKQDIWKLLQQFIDNTDDIHGADLGILLTFRGSYNGAAAGNLNGLCNSWIHNKLAAAIVRKAYSTVPTYSQTVKIITHELGHLIGSPHTHSCAWNGNKTAIDGCGDPYDEPLGYNKCDRPPKPDKGTIMSYCNHKGMPGIDFNLGFGEQPGDLIRDKVRNATCLQCITPETISNKTYSSNCTIIGCENLNFENVTINNNAKVIIYAGEKIRLKPNFRAQAGTTVKISIVPPATLSPPQSSMVVINNESGDNLEEEIGKDIHKKPEITLFPNPNSGSFQLETNFPLSDISNLKITNLMGVTVYETQHLVSNEIKLQNPVDGLHFVVMHLKDSTLITQKVMVQR